VAFGLGRQGRRGGRAVLAGAAAFGGGVLIGVLTPAAGPAPAAVDERAVATLRADGALPAWLAPGARLTVTGWGEPLSPVSLVVDGRRAATARSGSRGRVELTARLTTPGLHRLELVSGGMRVRAGRLLVRPIRVAAGGDVTPGEGVAEAVAAHGLAYPWSSVAPVLRRADIATVNLEGVISTRGEHSAGRQYHFRGGPGLLRGAAAVAGVDVVTVANNHALDFGRTALLDTLAAARAAGVRTVGAGATDELARRPAIVTAGGLRVAFLGYTDVRPLGTDAGPDWAGAARADPATILADVRAARGRADVVVVWFHWGEELAREPSSRQRGLASVALAGGASLVLGAHPHVLQPLTRDRRRLVAWSLGNFVFPAASAGTTRTGILLADLDARGVAAARLRPATIHGFRPVVDRAALD
jgi:poly-gamma-glutamate capsule biosynthesis protein CapA/YwtB (metallophosphatase superfamily)